LEDVVATEAPLQPLGNAVITSLLVAGVRLPDLKGLLADDALTADDMPNVAAGGSHD